MLSRLKTFLSKAGTTVGKFARPPRRFRSEFRPDGIRTKSGEKEEFFPWEDVTGIWVGNEDCLTYEQVVLVLQFDGTRQIRLNELDSDLPAAVEFMKRLGVFSPPDDWFTDISVAPAGTWRCLHGRPAA
ncbi:MAG: hypothetical protein AB7S41_10750 [Parvibaculaceae bacterium]